MRCEIQQSHRQENVWRHRNTVTSFTQFALLTSVLLVCPGAQTPASPSAQQRESVTDAATPNENAIHISAAIDAATDYIIRTQRDDGRFQYLAHVDPDVSVAPDYNILRHCGTTYALGMAYHRAPDDRIAKAIHRAQCYLIDSCLRDVPGEEGLLAIWSDPEITGERESVAKLGGSGLGLLALLALGPEHSAASMQQLQQLGRFITFMQDDDGRFVSKFVPTAGGKDRSWNSLYYPGEAAFGLFMLYEADHDLRFLQAAADALRYLAETRADDTFVPADHWALLATAALLPLLEKCERTDDNALLRNHALQICESMIRNKNEVQKFTPEAGCFTADGTTTPTATRAEGLLAALHMLENENDDARSQIQFHAQQAIAFILKAQIAEGSQAGGFPRAIGQIPRTHPMYSETFNRRAGEVRIDYVQHALSALIQYERIVKSDNE